MKKSIFLIILLLGIVVFALFLLTSESDSEISVVKKLPENGFVRNKESFSIEFSKPLPSNIDSSLLVTEPYLFGDFSVSSNTVSFTPVDSYVAGTIYSFNVAQIIGDQYAIKGNSVIRFSAINLSFNALSEEEKASQIAAQAPSDERYPILKLLPFDQPEYRLNYTFNSADFLLENGDTQENAIIIYMNIFGSASAEDPDRYEFTITENKKLAFEYLRSNGVEPNDFTIIYDPKIARDL